MALTLKSAGAIVKRQPANPNGDLMKVKILNQIFVDGALVLPGDVVSVDENTAISLVNMKEAEFLPDDYQPSPEALREEAAFLRKKADGLEYQAEEIETEAKTAEVKKDTSKDLDLTSTKKAKK